MARKRDGCTCYKCTHKKWEPGVPLNHIGEYELPMAMIKEDDPIEDHIKCYLCSTYPFNTYDAARWPEPFYDDHLDLRARTELERMIGNR